MKKKRVKETGPQKMKGKGKRGKGCGVYSASTPPRVLAVVTATTRPSEISIDLRASTPPPVRFNVEHREFRTDG
jgi:hypothetical protein